MPGMMRLRRSRLLTVVACAVACAAAACASTPPRQAASEPTTIGTATMEADGTIVLFLNATAPGGIAGHGYFRYPIGHKEYDDVLEHLGGLRPGESKPVPPWPDPPK